MNDHLIRQLTLRDSTLSQPSRNLLRSGFTGQATVRAGDDIVRQHDRPDHCTVVLSGWACRYSSLPDGRRHTLALHISGDFVDLHSFPLKVMDHGVSALTDCAIMTIPHSRVRHITTVDPHLTRVLWLHTLVDAAILRQWLLSASERSALEHAAHLVCELFTRLRIVGMASEGRPFELPIMQREFGAALGVSAVHVSRTLAELRKAELFHWRSGEARILDWEGLQKLAKFDPTYLMLNDEPR